MEDGEEVEAPMVDQQGYELEPDVHVGLQLVPNSCSM
jgi:hypothetical protein